MVHLPLASRRVEAAREHVTRHTSHVTRHTSHVTRHTSHATRHTPHVTRHTSHVTRHTSHVTLHTSHVTRIRMLAHHQCLSFNASPFSPPARPPNTYLQSRYTLAAGRAAAAALHAVSNGGHACTHTSRKNNAGLWYCLWGTGLPWANRALGGVPVAATRDQLGSPPACA